jgi:protein-disulfide isomerase-like protein with CxxC motif
MTDLDAICEAARKRLARGVAISAGMHAAKVREAFAKTRAQQANRHAMQKFALRHVGRDHLPQFIALSEVSIGWKTSGPLIDWKAGE